MVNKVILIGNLGSDPEVRYTGGGTAVTNFNIATTDVFNNKEGNREERTEWHKIVVWGKRGENGAQYLSKGRSAYIEGSLQTRNYDDKDGIKRYVTEVKAMKVVFLGGKSDGGYTASESKNSNGQGQSRNYAPPQSQPQDAPPPADDFDDDIPF